MNAASNYTSDYRTIVLLVDDQALVGEAVRRLVVTDPDIAFHYCSDPARALDQARLIGPTVILQDLVMPGIDGLELVRRYRADGATARTPIIVLSTREDAQTKSQAFELGANDYLVKLPDRVELLARIRYHSRAHVAQLQRDAAYSALRESQLQLLESNTALLELNRQLNEIVGMAAHDLRNPLGIVLGFSKLLERTAAEGLSPRDREFLARIRTSSEFMLRLVDDLLDISKIEAGDLVLDRRPTDLVKLADRNVALNRLFAEEKRIEITFAAAPDVPLVEVDPDKIEQVLNNLISNAVKFSHPGSRVEVAIAHDHVGATIAVRDVGQGIPAGELDKLFKPFGRTSVKGTGGEKSTGLGLAIAKRVVDGHGGHIAVESLPGAGSTFTVTLPA